MSNFCLLFGFLSACYGSNLQITMCWFILAIFFKLGKKEEVIKQLLEEKKERESELK